jgi:hypothetical protein
MPTFLLIDPATRRVVAKQQSPTVIVDPRYVVVNNDLTTTLEMIPESPAKSMIRQLRESARTKILNAVPGLTLEEIEAVVR